MPETPDFEQIALMRGMWAACADDLRRWAKAFASPDTSDPRTREVLTTLAEQLEKQVYDGHA